MTEDQFLALCLQQGYDEKILLRLQKALAFAKKILSEKKRLAGDSYYDHNLRVAIILVENNIDPDIIMTGILNGVLEHVSLKEFSSQFDKSIFSLLDGMKSLQSIKSKSPSVEAEAMKRMILTSLQDIRVLFIKLAAKLDNLRTIHVFPSEIQQRISQEVLEIYAPLAYRLGMDKIRILLEDTAFKVINPRKYEEIEGYLAESAEAFEKGINLVIQDITQLCAGKVAITKIKGRKKNVYSIYKKIQKGRNLRDIFDILGIRIIVPEEKDCYIVLGLLHENFEPLEGRLKDYIANPKPNFYRSIHTGLRFPQGRIVEVQIRTEEMDRFADEGFAAHWRYKEMASGEILDKKIAWLKGILELHNDAENKEFLETLKIDIFGDKIYCYTPKGDIKELPAGATLLDFAYSVHEEIGSTAVAGRVNGKFVPLKHFVKFGDVVEVITNKNQRPRRSWLKIVTSPKSKQKIRKSLRVYEKLPPLHYRTFKPEIQEEQGLLVDSEEFPHAICLLAKCCNPLPDQEIIGIITKKKIISTHRHDCRYALQQEHRWVPVYWKKTFNQKIRFYVNAEERSGLLADLLHTIAKTGFEVKEAKAKLLDTVHAQCQFSVIPRDLNHLKDLIIRVEKVQGVMKMYFE
ncbi:bifunctional (p)ppGpp synthetase/guanosine-3',5'-bis(diphosphate) 3'-pyrophosphohydrolase [Candidatus Woesearchaeota archaeon]|nr:bifunctional (p)ppGpp synthetase/guanosine-3',5'-bis(diphosphate) 3'-pyrophosphohydrolase [Candidatus Woesearchaeota archaeon]